MTAIDTSPEAVEEMAAWLESERLFPQRAANDCAALLRALDSERSALQRDLEKAREDAKEALRLYGAALDEKADAVRLLDKRTELLRELRSWSTSEWVKPSFRELLARVDASLPSQGASP